MDVSLTDEQSAWLTGRVTAGEFSSVEQAVHALLDDLMEGSIDTEDLEWVKPLVEEARRSIAKGDVVSLEDHRAHTAELLARLGAR